MVYLPVYSPVRAKGKKPPPAGQIQEPKRVSDMNNAEIAFSLFDENRD